MSIVLLFKFVSPLRASASWYARIWMTTMFSFCTAFGGLVLTRTKKVWNGEGHSSSFSTFSWCGGSESGTTASGIWWGAMIWRRKNLTLWLEILDVDRWVCCDWCWSWRIDGLKKSVEEVLFFPWWSTVEVELHAPVGMNGHSHWWGIDGDHL